MRRKIGNLYYAIREQSLVRPAIKVREVLGHPIEPIHILGFARGGSTIMAELIAESIRSPCPLGALHTRAKSLQGIQPQLGMGRIHPKDQIRTAPSTPISKAYSMARSGIPNTSETKT